MLSIFGGRGFVGRRFSELFSQNAISIEPREKRTPNSNEIVYFISTTDNYNVLTDPFIDINANLTILIEVLSECKKKYEEEYKPYGKSFIINFISSFFVYGDNPKLPVTEKSVCLPKGFYSITKRCAEELLISYCKTFGLNYRILRLCNIYGPGDEFSSKKNALQFIFDNLINNREVKLYNDGNFYRDFLHVKDTARAIKLCVEKGPLDEIINIGSGNKYRFSNIIELAKNYLGSKSQIVSIDPPKFHDIVGIKNFYMDTSKLKALGFKPEYDIESGIKELLDVMKS